MGENNIRKNLKTKLQLRIVKYFKPQLLFILESYHISLINMLAILGQSLDIKTEFLVEKQIISRNIHYYLFLGLCNPSGLPNLWDVTICKAYCHDQYYKRLFLGNTTKKEKCI
jgi:hypothetical protein